MKAMDKADRKSIMYVNYAPYGNAGCILDYLRSAFDEVVYVSFVFHPVGADNRNTVEIYRNGVSERKFHVPTFRVPKAYVYQSAFLLSILAGIELVILTIYLRLKHKAKPVFYLAPNAFLVFVGVFMRTFSLVRNVVFWVWDYYPTPKRGAYKKFLFRVYWGLDRWCTRKADFVWYLNQRLLDVRKAMGVETIEDKHYVAPLGINPIDKADMPQAKADTLGFVGVLKKGQGLDLLLDTLLELSRQKPRIRVEIIGGGPDEAYFKEKADDNAEGRRVEFLGFIENDEEMRKTVSTWAAGVALYIPSEENVASFTDPSKVRLYMGCGVPVIMTGVPEISEKISRNGAGLVIGYDKQELVRAVTDVLADNTAYKENSLKMARDYEYHRLYDSVFDKIFEGSGQNAP